VAGGNGERGSERAKIKDDETPELTLAVIEDLKGKGFNQSEIADAYGVSRQAVSWHKTTYSGRLTPRELVMKEFPFPGIRRDFTQTAPYRCLRHHGEYIATGGVGMSAEKLQRLRTFYKRLRDEYMVLEFDPSIPPQDGISKVGGWAYRHRRPTDSDLLVRVNEYTNLTDEGRKIWRFPAVDP
jgi:hypothetical protein